MHVTLIKLPSLMAVNSLSYHQSAPSLGLAYIAAAIRSDGHRVSVIDAVGDDPRKYKIYSRKKNLLLHGLDISDICDRIGPETEVVGIQNMFLHEFNLLEDTVSAIKSRYPHVRIILGGENATSLWDVIMRDIPGVDVCVLGEGEQKISLILDSYSRGESLSEIGGIAYRQADGQVVRTGNGTRIKEISSLAEPAWDLFPLEAYMQAELNSGTNRGRSIPMMMSRGCPYKCKFCSAPEMWTTKYVTRSAEEVVNEIAYYIKEYRVTNIDFQDLTSFINKKWIREFCEIIERRGLEFTWQIPSGSRSEVIDDESSDLLYRSGCRNYTFAPESGSERLLKAMKKQLSLPRIIRAMKVAKQHKLIVDANIIIGTPEETGSDLWSTYVMILQFALAGIDAVGVMTFSPYPGSEYYHYLVDRGELVFNEDYIYSSLLRVSRDYKSYNPRFTAGQILLIQYTFLISFFGLLYLLHPWYLLRSIRNSFANIEESKVEQLLITKYKQRKILRNLKMDDKYALN